MLSDAAVIKSLGIENLPRKRNALYREESQVAPSQHCSSGRAALPTQPPCRPPGGRCVLAHLLLPSGPPGGVMELSGPSPSGNTLQGPCVPPPLRRGPAAGGVARPPEPVGSRQSWQLQPAKAEDSGQCRVQETEKSWPRGRGKGAEAPLLAQLQAICACLVVRMWLPPQARPGQLSPRPGLAFLSCPLCTL